MQQILIQLSIALVLTACSSTVQRKPDNTKGVTGNVELTEDFKTQTGLTEGKYILAEKADAACDDGSLRLVAVDDELSLLLGAHALVAGIGRSETMVKERDCTTVTKSEYSKGKVWGVRTENCNMKGKKLIHSYETSVLFTPTSIQYTRKNMDLRNKKVLVDVSCSLLLNPNP